MTKHEISTQIETIIAQILNVSENDINANSNNIDMAEWDSMRHVQIIDAVEKAFEIQFDLLEVIEFESAADIAAAVTRTSNEV